MQPKRAIPPTVLDVLGVRTEDEAAAFPAPVEDAVVDCAIYVDGVRRLGDHTYDGALREVRLLNAEGNRAFLWLGLREPTEHQMACVADTFDLHPIPVENSVQAMQRPKVERYDDLLFVVVKTVHYLATESLATARRIAETGEIMIFVAPEFVITVRHGDHNGLSALRRRLETEGDELNLGPYAVMQAIIGSVVDHYLHAIAPLESHIDDAEEEAFSPAPSTGIQQVYLLKRDVVDLRRAIGPLGIALQKLTTEHKDLLQPEIRSYLRDVSDGQAQAADQIVAYDDMLSGLVEAAIARTGLQQTIDMRKISAWVAIGAVPTMIAGIYGMNFDYMPELAWRWGHAAVLTFMAGVCVLIYAKFRRNHWL